MNTNNFLNNFVIELKAFMANHHTADFIPLSAIKRVSGRPALDDIENNTYPPVAALAYWLSDDWKADSIGQSSPNSQFGITIIGSDIKNKKRDEVAFELKDRLQAYLQEACFVDCSRFKNIKATGGAIKFDNGKMVNLIEITFECAFKQGQSKLYALDKAKDIDIGHENEAILGFAGLGEKSNGY